MTETDDEETSVRTLRDELNEEMRKYETRKDPLITVYFNDDRDQQWREIPVTILDDYVPHGGDIDAVAYSVEYVYVLERLPMSRPSVPVWTFRGVPQQNRLFSLNRLDENSEQTQLTDLPANDECTPDTVPDDRDA